MNDPIGEGMAWLAGKLHVGGIDEDDAAQGRERIRSGFPWQEFRRVEGERGQGLFEEMRDGRYQEIPHGDVEGSVAIEVLGRGAELGIPAGWSARDAAELARMPGNDSDGAVCAALYRVDADLTLVYSLLVLAMRGNPQVVARKFDPGLWCLAAERQTGLRTVGRIVCVRLGTEPAYVWHLAGTMAGTAVGRPNESMVEVRSSELWCPLLPSGIVKVLLVAPPERMREGQDAFGSLVSSWRWIPA